MLLALLEHFIIFYYLTCLFVDVLFVRSPYNIPAHHTTLLRALPEGQTVSGEIETYSMYHGRCFSSLWHHVFCYLTSEMNVTGSP